MLMMISRSKGVDSHLKAIDSIADASHGDWKS